MSDKEIIAKRINKLLNTKEFELSMKYLRYIHNYIFKDIASFEHPDMYRIYNITKREEILNGDTVIYTDFRNILSYLNYDIEDARKRSYKTVEDTIKNIAKFNARIWQVHPFEDGNTRTTSIFIRKYLTSLDYEYNNLIFYNHFKYYRNALVRANYYNPELDISTEMKYIEDFYRKLLQNNTIKLENDLTIPSLFLEENKTKKLILTK